MRKTQQGDVKRKRKEDAVGRGEMAIDSDEVKTPDLRPEWQTRQRSGAECRRQGSGGTRAGALRRKELVTVEELKRYSDWSTVGEGEVVEDDSKVGSLQAIGGIEGHSEKFGFYSKSSERAVCRVLSRGELNLTCILRKNTGRYVNGEWIMGS